MLVVLLEHLDYAQEERVLRHRAHYIVGDTSGYSAAHPRGISEQRIQATIAALVRVRVSVSRVTIAR